MNPLFSERKRSLIKLKDLRPPKGEKKPVDPPEGLFIKCEGCGAGHPKALVSEQLYVCPKCGYHIKINAYLRLSLLFDQEEYRELFQKVPVVNPIGFPEYEKKLQQQAKASGIAEAAVTAVGSIGGVKTVVVVLDCSFLMGSMGSAVGEKVTRSVEYAHKSRLPLVIFSASGGARMQEGIYSLMQMAKTSAALKKFADAGGFYLSFLTHPTTGGVTASFASLGDVILAEPKALIGFAGPRVIEQTIRQTLPEGFQTAEFLLQHGFVDAIVSRQDMKSAVAQLLQLHSEKVKK